MSDCPNCDAIRADLAEERKIIDRVWKALGVESYDAAGGKSIDELVAELRADLRRKEEQHAETRGLVRDLTTVLEKRNADLRAVGAALASIHRADIGPHAVKSYKVCELPDLATPEIVSIWAVVIKRAGIEGVVRRETPSGTMAWQTDDPALAKLLLREARKASGFANAYLVRFDRAVTEKGL